MMKRRQSMSSVDASTRLCLRRSRRSSSMLLLLASITTSSWSSALVPVQILTTHQKSSSLTPPTTSSVRGNILQHMSGQEDAVSKDEGDSSTTLQNTTTTVQFGDVVPLKRSSASTTLESGASFGDVVPLKKKEDKTTPLLSLDSAAATSTAPAVDPEQMKLRNIAVAIASIGLAIGNYAWAYAHPIQPIQLLFEMEQNSSPVTVIGTTSKPTVVDFWAPWCENCKVLAPTLRQVEEDYKDKVNFVMVNGDSPQAWPLIEAFGVDAIPHMALVESDGTVETALIGPVPKSWLTTDLDVLIENSAAETKSRENQRTLPFQMLDVFANRPEQRRIVVSPVSN